MVECYQPLTDSLWQVMEPLLPTYRQRRHSLQQVLDDMLYSCLAGCQWRNLPTCFPPWPTVCYYFARWRTHGMFDRLSQASNRANRLAQGRLPTPSLALVDAQSVKLTPRLGQQRGLDAHKRVNGPGAMCSATPTGVLGEWSCTRPMATTAAGPRRCYLPGVTFVPPGPVGCVAY